MKILVTGAKGFVGKNLCAALKNIRDGKDRTRNIKIDEIFEYDIDTDMGNSSFDGNGGMQSDTVHKVKIDCDMGSVSMKFEEP